MSRRLPSCPDRCGGRADVLASTAGGGATYRCSRCGTVWAEAPPQATLFDAEAGAQLRDRGTALAAEAQGEAWQAWAREQIAAMVTDLGHFTADDLAERAEAQGRQPAHRNAIGSAFLSAARAGLIHWTGAMRPSAQRTAHRRLQRVWQGVPR